MVVSVVDRTRNKRCIKTRKLGIWHHGAKFLEGKCYLYINGDLLVEMRFKSVRDRKQIFSLWNKNFRLQHRNNWFIDVKYEKIAN